jgi:hypothetical protein
MTNETAEREREKEKVKGSTKKGTVWRTLGASRAETLLLGVF